MTAPDTRANGSSESYRITVPIHVRGPNTREHHHVKARRIAKEREQVAWNLKTFRVVPRLPARVTLTYMGPRSLDSDNVQGAPKGTRDEVARWLGTDDGVDAPVTWTYVQERTPAYYAVAIEVRSP